MDKEKFRKALDEVLPGKPDLVTHVIDNQLEPQILAEEMGEGATAELVNISPEATEGYLVTCHRCSRTARAAHPVPEGKVATCPPCIRALLKERQ